MRKTISQIIDAAGGHAKIADRTGLTASAVRKWPGIGIPDRHWPVLIAMARRNEVELTPDVMFRANRRARRSAPAA